MHTPVFPIYIVEPRKRTPSSAQLSYSSAAQPSAVLRRPALGVLRAFFFSLFFLCSHFYFPASGQAVVTGVVPSPTRFLPSIFVAHKVQQSHCSSIFHRVLLTHALALSASQFVYKKKFQRIYTSMHSAGLELTKLTYTRLQDYLIRHRGDRTVIHACATFGLFVFCFLGY